MFPSVIWVHAVHLGMRGCCRANLGAQHEKHSLCYSFYNQQLLKQLGCVPRGQLPPGSPGLCSGKGGLVNLLCSLDSREVGQAGERGPSLQAFSPFLPTLMSSCKHASQPREPPGLRSVCLAPSWLTVERPPIILLPWAVKLQVYCLWSPHWPAHMENPTSCPA